MSAPSLIVLALNPLQHIPLVSVDDNKATFTVKFEVGRGTAPVGAVNVDGQNAGIVYVNLRSLNHFFTGAVNYEFDGQTPVVDRENIAFTVAYSSPEQIEFKVNYRKGPQDTIPLKFTVFFSEKTHQP